MGRENKPAYTIDELDKPDILMNDIEYEYDEVAELAREMIDRREREGYREDLPEIEECPYGCQCLLPEIEECPNGCQCSICTLDYYVGEDGNCYYV